jgi:hypothetical protein
VQSMRWDPNSMRLVVSFADCALLAVLSTRYIFSDPFFGLGCPHRRRKESTQQGVYSQDLLILNGLG